MARLMPIGPAGSLQLQIKLVFIIRTIYFEPPHRNGWLRAIVPRIGNLCKDSYPKMPSSLGQHSIARHGLGCIAGSCPTPQYLSGREFRLFGPMFRLL